MPTVLDEIVSGVRADLAGREAAVPLAEIRRRAEAATSRYVCLGCRICPGLFGARSGDALYSGALPTLEAAGTK